MSARSPKRSARARRPAAPALPASAPETAALRRAFGLTREHFARLVGYSVRAIAAWESGTQQPGDAARVRLAELDRLRQALGRVLRPEALGAWLGAPNPAFEGLKPLEAVERGQMDRLWRMVFQLEAGVPA